MVKKKKDEKIDFGRSWPQKAPKNDIKIEMDSSGISASTGSGLLCSTWCVSFKSDYDIKVFDVNAGGYMIVNEKPNFTICMDGFLDGNGTAKKVVLNTGEGFTSPSEFEFLCDGYNKYDQNREPLYIPEFGHLYHVTASGTKPLFEESECWPSHIC